MTKKKIITIAIILTALVLLPILLFILFKSHYEQALNQPNSTSTESVEFEIIQGESIDSIIPSLIAQDLLKEEYRHYFLIYLKTNNIIPKIQAGNFNIPKSLNMKELAQTLQSADAPSIWVTIPEGLRMDEIANIFSKNFVNINEQEFLSLATDKLFIQTLELSVEGLETLEGFLFPD